MLFIALTSGMASDDMYEVKTDCRQVLGSPLSVSGTS